MTEKSGTLQKSGKLWIKNIKAFEAYIKMEKIIKFGGIEMQNQKRHQYEETISIKNKDINKIVVSSKVPFS